MISETVTENRVPSSVKRSVLLEGMDPETGFLDASKSTIGLEFQPAYQVASPFPHAVIDDFLPVDLARKLQGAFAISEKAIGGSFNREQERLKRSYMPDMLSNEARGIFYAFNSLPFIRIVENITGIKGLVPDPYFFGAGLHEIQNGGHLSVHVDFNHHKPMNLARRVNLLIYLNDDWKPEYGGELELWNREMTECVQSIVPVFNRCVIFNTDNGSNHGNPHPVSHPSGISRKSVALYYYTATWTDAEQSHTTQFRVRPGSKDKFDFSVAARELMESLTPPILWRGFQTLKSGKSKPAL